MLTINSIIVLFLMMLGIGIAIRLGLLLMLTNGDWSIIIKVAKEKFFKR